MPRFPAAGVALAALALALFVPAHAVTVSGQVVDERGFGIFDVDLDFTDVSTGQIVFTPFDNTDAGGFYSVTVPVGRYDILFQPPTTEHLSYEMRDVDIDTDTIINVTLEDAYPVTGIVRSSAGSPLANVDLDFLDLATGDILNTNNDNTLLDGTFTVYVSNLTYDVYFTPPLGAPFAGHVVRDVVVAAPLDLGSITLSDGWGVHARVLGNGGLPVPDVDLDFEDTTTGAVVYTPRDNTDPTGNVTPILAAGSYDVIVRPQAVTGLAWKGIRDVTVAGPTDLGDVQLLPGFAVTGTVRNAAAQPVAGADLDMIETATGLEVPTANDNTNAAGAFSLVSHATTLDLVVKPPPGTPLAAAILRGVAVSGATNVGVITLVAGFPITGIVRDLYGSPVAGADLDAFSAATGLKHPTPGDDTDAAGAYAIRLPAGTWHLTATPPAGSGLLPATRSVTLLAPAVVDFTLPSSTVDAPAVSAGVALRLAPASPNPFRDATRLAFELPRAENVRLTIVDVMGRTVRRLVRGPLPAGGHDVTWNGRDDLGRPLAAGVYFYRLETESGSLGGKAALLR